MNKTKTDAKIFSLIDIIIGLIDLIPTVINSFNYIS